MPLSCGPTCHASINVQGMAKGAADIGTVISSSWLCRMTRWWGGQIAGAGPGDNRGAFSGPDALAIAAPIGCLEGSVGTKTGASRPTHEWIFRWPAEP